MAKGKAGVDTTVMVDPREEKLGTGPSVLPIESRALNFNAAPRLKDTLPPGDFAGRLLRRIRDVDVSERFISPFRDQARSKKKWNRGKR